MLCVKILSCVNTKTVGKFLTQQLGIMIISYESGKKDGNVTRANGT
jgi:hypothetical protein